MGVFIGGLCRGLSCLAPLPLNLTIPLKQYYERIKGRRGSGKAIIATARKVLGIIYRTLKHKWMFADFPNFVLAEQ